MPTKTMRQSSRQATDIHRQFGRTGRVYKRDATQVTMTAVDTKKKSLWARLIEFMKSLIGR
jgi:hypothetical protein